MSSGEEDFVLAPKAKSVSAAKPPKKAKGVGEQYQKLGQLEHILKRPDTYIGSVQKVTEVWKCFFILTLLFCSWFCSGFFKTENVGLR